MKQLGVVLFFLVFATFSLSGGLITNQPAGGATTTFPGGTSCYSGPTTGTVAGFSISATGDACYNYDYGWGLDDNGQWNMGLIGDNSGSTLITINLGGLYSSVGGFVNYAPGYGDPIMTAIAGDGTTVLESWNLATYAPISTPGATNGGAFRGIDMGSPVIGYLRIGGSYFVMHDITLDSEAIPEPSTALLAAGALVLLGLTRLRRRA